MRVALPNLRPNGHPPRSEQVYAIVGMCEDPRFRLRAREGDFCQIYLGTAAFGAEATSASDPHFIWRRGYDDGQVHVALRVELEGVFMLLANDDEHAESVCRELIEPSGPEELRREWTTDNEICQLYAEWLGLE